MVGVVADSVFVTGEVKAEVSKTKAEVTKLGDEVAPLPAPRVVVESDKSAELVDTVVVATVVGEAIGTSVDAGCGILESVKRLPVGKAPVAVRVSAGPNEGRKLGLYEAVPV